MAAEPQPHTIHDFLCFYMPSLETDHSCPSWPPDLFGLMSILLERSGAYLTALEEWPPSSNADPKEYANAVTKTADEWRTKFNPASGPPQIVVKIWKRFWLSATDIPMDKLAEQLKLSQQVLTLLAIADQTCSRLGQLSVLRGNAKLQFAAIQRIAESQGTLGKQIPASNLIILPKRRTPQNGLNIRSLSLHLCAFRSSEIQPVWSADPFISTLEDNTPSHCFNLLLVPLPTSISPVNFEPVEASGTEMRNMDKSKFGFVTFRASKPTSNLAGYVIDLLEQAKRSIGKVDALVFPEGALSNAQFNEITAALEANDWNLMIFAGIAESAESKVAGENKLGFYSPRRTTLFQHKHHRWQLNRDQILQYHLGSALSPLKSYWEYITLKKRQIHFIQTVPWLLVAPLICEDLARPDPAGELIRAVGPDLVIALLMDGPQLTNRWAARNAITLADDPGCAVLSFTSSGMVDLSNVGRSDGRRVVALFKDPTTGVKEIELPKDKEAVVLTLSRDSRVEWSADGRFEASADSHPILSGVHFVSRGEVAAG